MDRKTYFEPERYVKIIGRSLRENGCLWFAHSGSGVEFMMHGTFARALIKGDRVAYQGYTPLTPFNRPQQDAYARYAVYVNGERTLDDLLDEPEKEILLFSSEEARDVTIRLVKLSESDESAFGISFIEVEADEEIRCTPDKALKIEFIGDSVTCGYGVDDEVTDHPFRTATEDATKAYAYKAAELLDADYSLVAYSGHGIVSGYTDTGEKLASHLVPPVYEQFAKTYRCSEGFFTETAPWDFGQFLPDIVVINLGTNDDSYTGDDSERAEEFTSEYVNFLQMVRRHNLKAHIVCAFGVMGDRLFPAIVDAASRYRRETGDERISVCHLTPQDDSCGYVVDFHPRAATHTRAAKELAVHISREVLMKRLPGERRRRLDSLFEAFSIVAEGTYVYVCDMKYDCSRWSKSAVDTFGLPSEYMFKAGEIWERYIHPDDRSAYHDGIAAIFGGNASGHDMQYRARKNDGDYEVCTCRGVVIRDETDEPEYFGGVIRNHGISEHIDTLTGLRNHYGFFEDLKTCISRHTEICVCMVGISKFSDINEVYGYHFGNSVLQKFGRYLFEFVGNTGSVYRLDGIRFAVISSVLKTGEITEYYERFREHFRNGFSVEDHLIVLELNAGVLTVDNFSVKEETVNACLNYAYGISKTRRQGDLVEFINDLTDENRYRIEKLQAIRFSITRGYSGFFLLYQPVVDAGNETLTGAEALLRWRSEEYGVVPPDHFIPLIENDPLFPDLGQWILRTALRDTLKIMEQYSDFVINVNLSYTQLQKPDFANSVLRILREENFPPEHLCLEITERCRLLDISLLKDVIVNLRGHGIRIALDDFGTGFSSIGLVKNLPFDTIKIDRSFVMKIEEDEKERRLIEHFTGVASTFGAKVCVEGIETAEMRDILQQYCVQSFQGYFYSRPLDIEVFLEWESAFISRR